MIKIWQLVSKGFTVLIYGVAKTAEIELAALLLASP